MTPAAPSRHPWRGRLLLAGPAVAVFVATLYLQLPASLLLRWLPSPLPLPWSTPGGGLVAEGTVWNGQLSGLGLLGHPVGQIRWHLSPWRALCGQLAGAVEVEAGAGRRQGRMVATVAFGLDGTGTLTSLAGEWPLANLQPASRQSWRGQLQVDIARLHIDAGRFGGGEGRLRVTALTAPGTRATLGDFEVVWPEGSDQGRVRDLAGAVELRAALLRRPEDVWQLVGEAAPRPAAPAEVRQALLMFGPPDAGGRHPLRLEFGVSPPP